MALNPRLASVVPSRPARRRGFCPACRFIRRDDAAQGAGGLALPAVAVAATLAAAGAAWAFTIAKARSMSGTAMGLGPWETFAVTWVAMMAAMMLPSALPLVVEFTRHSEGRRTLPLAAVVLALAYIAVWLAFGVACYAVYGAIGMPWTNQGRVGGAALVLAGVYGLTPLQRAGQARCRELCALQGPLPFNLLRSAATVGLRYGLSCAGCSAGLMVALVLIDMANLPAMVLLAAVVLAYKLAPPLTWRQGMLPSLGLAAAGLAYAVLA